MVADRWAIAGIPVRTISKQAITWFRGSLGLIFNRKDVLARIVTDNEEEKIKIDQNVHNSP